ncbi:uncharacterized protein ABDE67_016919 [Symphorus nematophorus]
MDAFESRLSEQVRLYKHLYDRSLREYRDNVTTSHSWREIAAAVGREEAFCRRVWKNTRDRFVKAKRTQRAKRGGPGAQRKVPPILLELEWLSQFVKHRDVDSNTDFEDDGVGLDNKVQETPLNFCTLDATRVDPPSSSVTPGTLSPSRSEPSSSSAETTSFGGSSPSVRDSPSPLNLFVTAATPSTRPGLLSPVPRRVNHPKPSTSPCTTDAERRTTDCVLCVAHQDQERQKPTQQENADSRFCEVIKDMLANVNPVHKADVKFKIYQLLFEAEKDFPRES